jgi:pimeloyl-ACP methyl ester carboxylesterase
VLVVPGWWASPERTPSRLSPTAAAVFERALRSDFAFWVICKFFPSAAIGPILGTPPSIVAQASAGERARVDGMLWGILPISQRTAGLLLEARLTVEPLSEPLSSLRVPTLSISAKDDLYGTWENAQFIVNQVPHARLLGYSVGGHLLVGHTDEVLASIGHFLEDNASDAPR